MRQIVELHMNDVTCMYARLYILLYLHNERCIFYTAKLHFHINRGVQPNSQLVMQLKEMRQRAVN